MTYPIPAHVYALLRDNPELSEAGNGRLLAERAGIPGRSARRYAGKFRSGEAVPQNVFYVKSEVYTGAVESPAVRQYTGSWKLNGDFLVINDVHIPATNWDFANRVLEVAVQFGVKKLAVVGDLFNGDALSRWDDVVLCTPLAEELDHSEDYLEHMADWFDEIWFSRGNHENRILLGLKGHLHAPQFLRMVTRNPKVHFSMYSYFEVTSGGAPWRLTHQVNYSKNPLNIARQLAAKFSTNVICAHQHHSAVGRSLDNRWSCIDSGGLHDHTKMSYVQLDDNTSPVMNNGFVLLKEGVGTLLTPYNTTDWDQWSK